MLINIDFLQTDRKNLTTYEDLEEMLGILLRMCRVQQATLLLPIKHPTIKRSYALVFAPYSVRMCNNGPIPIFPSKLTPVYAHSTTVW